MDWTAYKARCDRPDAWSRWMLGQTLELLAAHPDLAAPLRTALAGEPLAKPPGHKGGAATDMLVLDLEAALAWAIVEQVERAVALGAATSGTRGRGLGGFREAWREYGEFINQQQTSKVLRSEGK